MCGIAGFFFQDGLASEEARSIACRMSDIIAHRGPDSSGVYLDSQAGIALAHRRLAIIDLSSAGHQPMQSKSERYTIVFNGEIYNHSGLRCQFKTQFPNACSWRGRSDTETLLTAVECLGIEAALRQTVGMFAFALWDRKARTLYLARDRLGEKPLYYGWQNGVFLFGSELKALVAHPAFARNIDREALNLFLRYNYIPAPWSIYKGIRKLPAGAYLKLAVGQANANELPEPQYYWALKDAIAAGQTQPFEGNAEEAVEALKKILLQAVGQQMVADVPLGAFLSGGIDSSVVVALMQAQSKRPVRTFTIGFDEPGYNEADHAKAVATHLGTEHTEFYLSPGDALKVIPSLPSLYDEPFADSSQIPTFMVAGLSRQHVTVVLSGDGGDELFGGYDRYRQMHWLRCAWSLVSLVPRSIRQLSARAITGVSSRRRVHILAGMLACRTLKESHRFRLSRWKEPTALTRVALEPQTILTDSTNWPEVSEVRSWLMAIDTLSYLPDDLLVKVDRAAMGVSLETRAPFLDHRVVEFAWRLPLSVKIRGKQSKWALRQVLSKYLPEELFERPKMGFSMPLATWLRDPLRDWAEALLNEGRLRAEGFLDPQPIRQKWTEHLSGHQEWDDLLWNILMFQAWLEANQ